MTTQEDHQIHNSNFLYPELSFKIRGALFEVTKQLGGGHLEKHYENAMAIELARRHLQFQRQYSVSLFFNGQVVGKYRLDFLIDHKIVLELKQGFFIPMSVIRQTKQYLETLDLKLGMVACFTNNGVVIKRVLNLY